MNNGELHERFGVTSQQLDAWVKEYESGDWLNMKFGEISKDCPRITDDSLEPIMVKIPHSRLNATKKFQDE